MKKLLASTAVCLLVTTGAHAASFNFGFTFDGTDLTNDAGFDDVMGTSIAVGDDLTVDISAAGADFFRVLDGYNSAFVPLSFQVSEVDTRNVTSVANFFLDGVLVDTITETNVSESFVHFGANMWSLAAGLEFDQVLLNATLNSSSTTTTLTGGSSDFFEFFTGNGGLFVGADSIEYVDAAQVPLPAAGVLLLAGLGAFGAVGRKRRKAA